jgi:hypothetical protein
MIKAINPKNQSLVNKAVKYLQKYYELNDLRNVADNNGAEKELKKYNRMCEDVFDKYLDALGMLPKGQQQIIDKLIF